MTRDYPRVLILAMKGKCGEIVDLFEGGSGGQGRKIHPAKLMDVEPFDVTLFIPPAGIVQRMIQVKSIYEECGPVHCQGH